LQFAAQLLWEARDRRRRLLLRSAYDELGGVEGALARHADGVLGGLTPAELALSRLVMLRLVTPAGTRRTVARAALLEALEPAAEAERVVSRLTQSRLLSVRKAARAGEGDPRIELAHESLVKSWTTLARWLDESRGELTLLAEASHAAELWHRRGRREEELWRGAALSDALAVLAQREAVPADVRAFLRAGQRREAAQRRRKTLVAAAAMLGLALAALVFALQKRDADAQRDLAIESQRQTERERAQGLLEGARSALEHGRQLEARAKLRSLLELQDSPSARALWWRIEREPIRWRAGAEGVFYDVAIAPDGTIAAGTQERLLHLYHPETGAERTVRSFDEQVTGVAFSADGALLAAGTVTGVVHVFALAAAVPVADATEIARSRSTRPTWSGASSSSPAAWRRARTAARACGIRTPARSCARITRSGRRRFVAWR
jgi:hypothetical protein